MTAAARRGLKGPPRPFPHSARIQRAFGEHTPKGLAAHMGPAATEAGKAMGASGYVLNGKAAFTSAPDVRSAAHEAFHLFEQTRSPTASGAVGTPNDRSEQLADQVGEAVARGQPVDDLLRAAPPSGPGLQLGISKPKRHKVKSDHRAIRSSRFRFFRRLQAAYGGSRNIAMIKLVRGTGKNRHVLYVIGRSMGLGVRKLTLAHEEIETQAGLPKKRSHSEAVLRATLEVGQINAGGQTFDLSKFKPVYAASTNEGCGDEHENCSVESVPFLAPQFSFANAYSGSADASGFEKANNQHQRDVRNEVDDSEAESEDEYDAVVVDEDDFQGLNVEEDDPGHINATPFGEFFDQGPKSDTRRGKAYKVDGRLIHGMED